MEKNRKKIIIGLTDEQSKRLRSHYKKVEINFNENEPVGILALFGWNSVCEAGEITAIYVNYETMKKIQEIMGENTI